jgi:hypothetical protein
MFRLYLEHGLPEVITCVKSLCDYVAWVAVESVLDEPELAPALVGKSHPIEFWFLLREPSKEYLFLIRSWKRSLPKPSRDKVAKTLQKFCDLVSKEYECPLLSHADHFMDSWYNRFLPRRVRSPEITLTPAASFECTLKEGGKSVWFSRLFEEFLELPLVRDTRLGSGGQRKPQAPGGGPGMFFSGNIAGADYKAWGLPCLFHRLRLEGYLPGDPDEFLFVDEDPHERISAVLDHQEPPSADEPLYPSKVVPILERGDKCRVVTTAPAVVTTALQLLRSVIYQFLAEDHYCLILYKGYRYKSLGAWKDAHPLWWKRISSDPRKIRFLSTDLTSATDTFARSLVETLTRRFFGNFIKEHPKYRYLNHLIGFVFCPQDYILPDKTRVLGLRGTPMGNPANWAFLEIINEFALAVAEEAYYSAGVLMGGDPTADMIGKLTIPAVFCGDDNLTMFHDPGLFRLYEKYMSLCGGMISAGSHFESSEIAFFTEIPYTSRLEYIEVPKLRMLIEHENNLPDGKFENPIFYRGETISKAVSYLVGPLESMKDGILQWSLLRNFDIIRRCILLKIPVTVPRQYGGWGFTSPTGRVRLPSRHKKALKVLLRDDHSLKFVIFRSRLASIWNCSLSDGRYPEILELVEVAFSKMEKFFKRLEVLTDHYELVPVEYGNFRQLIGVKRDLEEKGWINSKDSLELISGRVLEATWGLGYKPVQGRSKSLEQAGRELEKVIDQILESHNRDYQYSPLRLGESTLPSSLQTRFFFKECSLWAPRAVIDFVADAAAGFLRGKKLFKVNRDTRWDHTFTMLGVTRRLIAEITSTLAEPLRPKVEP